MTVNNNNGHDHASTHNEIDVYALFHELLEHKWLIVIVTALVFSMGLFYGSRQVPEYRSNILLQLDADRTSFGQSSGGVKKAGGMFQNPMATQMTLIQSRVIAMPVAAALHLDINVYPTQKRTLWERLFSRDQRTISVSNFHVPEDVADQTYQILVDKTDHIVLNDAAGHMILQGPVGKPLQNQKGTIRIHVTKLHASVGTTFALAKRSLVSAAGSVLSGLRARELTAKDNQGTGIIEVSKVGTDRDKLVQVLEAIADVTQTINKEQKAKEASQTLVFLNEQMPKAKKALEEAENHLNQYYKETGKVNIKVEMEVLRSRLKSVNQEINRLRLKKMDMRQQYTAIHPIMKAFDLHVQTLKTERKQLMEDLSQLPTLDPLAVNLMRDIQVKKNLYMMLLNKTQEMKVMQAGLISNVQLLAKATPPETIYTQQTKLYMASLFLGLALSVMLIFARKILFPRIDDPHWVEQHLNIPNLAIVPHDKEQTKSMEAFEKGLADNLALLARIKSRSLAIESLRSLRTTLQISLPSSANNIVSILGVTPKVGKSFVSANLAYLLAMAGKRVILLDLDLRRGTLHRYMNVSAGPGMSNILDGTCSLDSNCIKNIHENLDFIPRGHYPSDPAELLMRSSFKTTLDTLSSQYDIVLIDTPPVLLVTDGVIISGYSALNYLVLGAGTHQPDEVEAAIKRLNIAGISVQGSIFNFSRTEKSGLTKQKYGKYGRYQYQYYYDDSMKT